MKREGWKDWIPCLGQVLAHHTLSHELTGSSGADFGHGRESDWKTSCYNLSCCSVTICLLPTTVSQAFQDLNPNTPVTCSSCNYLWVTTPENVLTFYTMSSSQLISAHHETANGDWDTHKDEIRRMWLVDKCSLKTMQKAMRDRHGFDQKQVCA